MAEFITQGKAKAVSNRKMNPNSLAALKKFTPMRKGGPWIGQAKFDAKRAGKKGGQVSGRTTVSMQFICRKKMRENGTVVMQEYLIDQGFHPKSRMNQEQLMYRLFESAIKEGNPFSMAELFVICQTGETLRGDKHAPQTQGSPKGLNANGIREVIVETARTWRKEHPTRIRPPRVRLPK